MIRTLAYVTVLALLAGLAMGFFVAEAQRSDRIAGATAYPLDPVLEAKVRLYQESYGLSSEQASEVRDALREYDQKLADLLRQLHVRHQDEFRTLADRANARIGAVLPKGR